MTRKFLKILLSLIAAVFFLWLAFREVNLPELWQQIRNINLDMDYTFCICYVRKPLFTGRTVDVANIKTGPASAKIHSFCRCDGRVYA
jgi:hypothetical protein